MSTTPTGTLDVIAVELKHVADNVRELKDDFKEQRNENAEWRRATEEKLKNDIDHHKRSVEQRLDALPAMLERKADSKDVSFLQKIVFGACGLILLAFMSAVIVLVWPKDHRPATSHSPASEQVQDAAKRN